MTLPSLATAANTIDDGRGSVSDLDKFWVKPNATDKLLRYTAFTRINSSEQTYVTSLMSGEEFDQVFETKDISFLKLPIESGYSAALTDSTRRASLLFEPDGTIIPIKITLPALTRVLDDTSTPLVDRLLTKLSSELINKLGVMAVESGYSFALIGSNGRSPLFIDYDGNVNIPKILLSNASIGLSQLKTDVTNRLIPRTARRLVAQITGVTPNRCLYIDDSLSGDRLLITSEGDPHDVIMRVDSHVSFETNAGLMYSAIPSRGIFPVYPNKLISCYGDSLTKSTGTDWPTTVLAPILGITCINHGIAGQGTGDISIRQGGRQPAVTLSGDNIPSSGTVAAQVSPSTGYRLDGSVLTYTFVGILEGITGSLIRNNSSGTWSFTRSTPGESIICPPGSRFTSNEAINSRNDIQIIWLGRNNVTQDTFESDVLAAHTQGLDFLSPYVKRCLHISVTNGANEGKGTHFYNKIISLNEKLYDTFGDSYFDLRRYLIDFGLSDADIDPTEADLQAILDDRPPPSLMADSIHPNAAGYSVCGRAIAHVIIEKGWLL